jgi:fatty acid desaturase
MLYCRGRSTVVNLPTGVIIFFLMCVTAILGLKVLMHALDHRSFERKKKYKDNHTSWFWRRPFAAVIAHGMSLNIFPILTF